MCANSRDQRVLCAPYLRRLSLPVQEPAVANAVKTAIGYWTTPGAVSGALPYSLARPLLVCVTRIREPCTRSSQYSEGVSWGTHRWHGYSSLSTRRDVRGACLCRTYRARGPAGGVTRWVTSRVPLLGALCDPAGVAVWYAAAPTAGCGAL